MTTLEFKSEVLDNYLDPDLQITIDKNPGKWTTGNGLLYSGLFYTILALNNAVDEEDKLRFSKMVLGCYHMHIPGLLDRNPARPDKEAQDDYVGVCAGSYFLSTSHASDIVSYGQFHNFCYDNTSYSSYSFSSWHGRFPGLIGYYKLAAKQPPGWLQTLLLIKQISCGVDDNLSDTILSWLKCKVIKRQSSRFNKAIDSWEESFVKHYGNITTVFANYFGNSHPFGRINIALTGEIS